MENGTEASLIAMHIMVVLAVFSSTDLLWGNSFCQLFSTKSIDGNKNFYI